MEENQWAGPSWDNTSEYQDLNSTGFRDDFETLKKYVEESAQQSSFFDEELLRVEQLTPADTKIIDAAVRLRSLADDAFTLAENLKTFVDCLLSVDGSHTQARQMQGVLDQVMAALSESLTSLELILTLAPDSFVEACLRFGQFEAHRFNIRQQRQLRFHMLSLNEEKILTRFSVNGPEAWGTLYSNMSSSLQCHVELRGESQTMGLARVAGYAQSSDREERIAGHRAVQSAWKTQRESCASILNALAGWRLDECGLRGTRQRLHFLDRSLHSSKIRRGTLETMMSVVEENSQVGREALSLKARHLKLDKLGPWDLFAPEGDGKNDSMKEKISFADAVEMVRSSFADIHPEMGEFVSQMVNNRWIEGTVADNKFQGAYCTVFAKSRNPRVFMTYRGSLEDVNTLAHELGHAFHSWVMRDLPQPETSYPMTLAETASIFAETLVTDVIFKRAATPAARRRILWSDLGSAEGYLLNIPARFWFECKLYERRADATLSPDEFSELMGDAWTRAYGNSISEMNSLFWCSKLHFHSSTMSFYNYPYTFGYLFALGVYAQRARQGQEFYSNYVKFLRDTGRMEVEDVARKHLGVDLEKPEFWQESIRMVQGKNDAWRELVEKQ